MNINTHSSPLKTRHFFRSNRPEQTTQDSSPSGDQVTLSSSRRGRDTHATVRKAIGGAVAGGVYSGLLCSLPVSMLPAFGVSTATAGKVWLGAVALSAAAGGYASATMPPGENWF